MPYLSIRQRGVGSTPPQPLRQVKSQGFHIFDHGATYSKLVPMNLPSLTSHISRRRCLASIAGAAAGAIGLSDRARAQTEEKLPPIRAITKGPRHHWFGYYDKLQFDRTGRYVLGCEIDFEHRSPKATDEIRIGMVDLADGDRWIELGKSSAFSWQQGCMLQWLPGSQSTVLWNDREGDHYVCRILDVATHQMRTIPQPIYAIDPTGTVAITTDFRRLKDTRPGYGYAGLEDPYVDQLAPSESGIWRVDLKTGEQRLIISLAEVALFGDSREAVRGAKHRFEHLLFNPDGTRIVFLDRFDPPKKAPAVKGKTRMLTASPEGKDLYVVDPPGSMSHFYWGDAEHILAWANPEGHTPGFYIFRDKTSEVAPIGAGIMTANGHCTYLPGNQWILNDTYPDKNRLQHPYLYHVSTNARTPLGHFYSPPEYSGEWRCDTHPRFSRDGKSVVIDSPHGGNGRQMYLIDIAGIVG